jgi:hypothetical protein
MRIAVVIGACLIAGCAGGNLATAPPAGVDLSGYWKLNEAESDDAQRLMQSQLTAATATNNNQSGASGRRRSQVVPQGPLGPVMPSVSLLAEALRWPGKNLSIKQTGALIEFSADGSVRDCSTHDSKARQTRSPSRGRGDAPPPRCGWDDKTLVVQSGEVDDDRPPYDQRFNLSEERDRLIEVVTFKNGASNGFTASRVWDRVSSPATANPAPGSGVPNSPSGAPK